MSFVFTGERYLFFTRQETRDKRLFLMGSAALHRVCSTGLR